MPKTVTISAAAWYRLGDIIGAEDWQWVAEQQPTAANRARVERATLALRGLDRVTPGQPSELPDDEHHALLQEVRWHLDLATPADLAGMADGPLKEEAQRRRIQLEAAVVQLEAAERPGGST